MLDGYYYCLNCHSEITPDYNEHCCFCGSAAVAVSGDYSPEEVETAFDLLNKQQQGLVVEVRHGRKIIHKRHRGFYRIECPICKGNFPSNKPYTEEIEYCSECGKKLDDTYQNYCPNCGAKMDGKEVANSG